MDAARLQGLIHKLKLPSGDFVLFGGTILAALDIRDAKDIDIFVTDQLFGQLEERGWEKKSQADRPPYLVSSIEGVPVQAFRVWEGGQWEPKITSYLKEPQMVNGLPFMPLIELYAWKAATRRPKDLEDMVLIDRYWDKN